MDQYLNNQRTGLLWDLLANPADKDAAHTQILRDLVNDYPQSGLLQALLTYVGDKPNLQRAAVYCNPRALYKLNKDIDGLHLVSRRQILSLKDSNPVAGYFHVGAVEHEVTANDLPPLVPDAGYEAVQHPAADALQVDVNAPVVHPEHETIAAPVEVQYLASPEPQVPLKTEPEPAIEEDTYDEIVSIDDINLAVQEYYATVMEPQTGNYEAAQFSDIYAEALKTNYEPKPIVEANPVAQSIAAEVTPAETQHLTPPEPQVTPVAEAKEERYLMTASSTRMMKPRSSSSIILPPPTSLSSIVPLAIRRRKKN